VNESKESLNAMNTQTAGYLILYGAFLIVMGLLGYLSNPEKAKTALISGSSFGVLSILWGVLGARGVRWSLPVALATTCLLALVFAWRASVGWLAVLDGKSEKLFAASLISVMFAGSVVMLLGLLKARKTGDAENRTAHLRE
jgi:uncharacterized membrane protein (UPF0136 family)